MSLILNRARQPLAYILIVSIPLFQLFGLNKPYAISGAFMSLGLLLLPAFFEIHKKILEPPVSRRFDNFQSVVPMIHDEIDRIARIGSR